MNRLVHFFFPNRCLLCREYIDEGEVLCNSCQKKAPIVREPFCHKCGKPLGVSEEEYCYDCQRKEHFFDRGYACLEYRPEVADSIYRFKYKDARYLSSKYAILIQEYFGDSIRQLACDYCIGVPISKERFKKRGYNQSDLLAKDISLRLGIAYEEGLVLRTYHTPPLKELSRHKRLEVLEQSFRIENSHKIIGKKILIVDDIYTTGATIDSMARLLKEAGASGVYFVCISIGKGI